MAILTVGIDLAKNDRTAIDQGGLSGEGRATGSMPKALKLEQGADWRNYNRSWCSAVAADPDERRARGTHSLAEFGVAVVGTPEAH